MICKQLCYNVTYGKVVFRIDRETFYRLTEPRFESNNAIN